MTFSSFRAAVKLKQLQQANRTKEAFRHSSVVMLCLSLTLQSLTTPCLAASKTRKDGQQPTGTLLLPLTPRIDTGTNEPPLGQPSDSGNMTYERTSLPLPTESGTPRIRLGKSARGSGSRSQFQAAKPDYAPASANGEATRATSESTETTGSSSAAENSQATFPILTTGAGEKPSDNPNQGSGEVSSGTSTTTTAAHAPTSPTTPTISAESGPADDSENMVDENSLLKGTVQIVADDTEYDQQKNTFLGSGNAVAIIAGQNSKLEADTILYDQNNGTIDARGNVKILRDGQLTTGSSFKFKVDSDEYLITNPDTELEGTSIIARTAKGHSDGILFRKATFTLPQPVQITSNAFYGPVSASERAAEEKSHPEAYVPYKPSFTFKARKMVYEKYKKDGNLTVYGGRLKFSHFTVPLPHFTATVGATNSRVVFPVTPMIGNNMMVGGLNVGPQFNYSVGKTGAFSWAPLIQWGGRTVTGGTTQSNQGKLGAGFKIGYSNDRISTHLAYGSVSNLLVGDFKYTRNDHQYFQSGINRFLNDGMFGVRRARLLAEAVDTRYVSKIPYLAMLQFRTSGGWAQDSPSLVNLSGDQYSQLFKQTHTGKVSAYRLQEQITASTHPLFAIGNDKYGLQMNLFAGVAAKLYSTGDHMLMGQFGPQVNARLNRLRLQAGYAQSGVTGQSPFVFDQFIQGSRSTSLSGDVKLAKWLTLGTRLGYNMDAKLLYTKAITAAIGPEDFKLMLFRDTISGYQRFGFDIISGHPVTADKLIMKGRSDAGQLGGI